MTLFSSFPFPQVVGFVVSVAIGLGVQSSASAMVVAATPPCSKENAVNILDPKQFVKDLEPFLKSPDTMVLQDKIGRTLIIFEMFRDCSGGFDSAVYRQDQRWGKDAILANSHASNKCNDTTPINNKTAPTVKGKCLANNIFIGKGTTFYQLALHDFLRIEEINRIQDPETKKLVDASLRGFDDPSQKLTGLFFRSLVEGKETLDVQCENKKTPFVAVSVSQKAEILAHATFHPVPSRQAPEYFLKFTAEGQERYIFIDSPEPATPSASYRLFVGTLGHMQEQHITEAYDHRPGDGSLVIKTQEGGVFYSPTFWSPMAASWIENEKKYQVAEWVKWTPSNLKALQIPGIPSTPVKSMTPCNVR